MKRKTLYISEQLHKQLKIQAVRDELQLTQLVDKVLSEYVAGKLVDEKSCYQPIIQSQTENITL